MNEKIKNFYRRSRGFFMESVLSVKELDNSVAKIDDVCDAIYMLREVDSYLDKLRKELDKLANTYKMAACLHMTQMHRKSYKSQFCTATKKPGVSRAVPSPSKPEEYREFLQFLGVPDEIIEAGLLRGHWPSISDWLTERTRKGMPVPKGLGEQTPTFNVQIRARRDILDDSDSSDKNVPEVVTEEDKHDDIPF